MSDLQIEQSGYNIVLGVWRLVIDETDPASEMAFKTKFMKGYNNRPSVRISNPTGTIPDPVIDSLIQARTNYNEAQINLIRFGHRLSMGAENILGLLLEEYIHIHALAHGWACCWGNSIPAADFCSTNGDLYQIKNRSNTENSSSNKIRKGTQIHKWYRINAATGRTYWDYLNTMIDVPNLYSEEAFTEFCRNVILRNPAALYVQP